MKENDEERLQSDGDEDEMCEEESSSSESDNIISTKTPQTRKK